MDTFIRNMSKDYITIKAIIKQFTGISDPFENPELKVCGNGDISETVNKILELM